MPRRSDGVPKLRLLAALLAATALLGAACTGTSPEAVDEGQPPDTTAAATTAPATSPPTTADNAEPAPSTTAVMPPEETLAGIERYITAFEPHLLEVTEAFDTGGLEAAVAMAKPPVLAEYPSEVLLVVDDSGHVVYHPNSDLIGVSIRGELGHDMYGYPWHEQFLSTPPGIGWVATMHQAGSASQIITGTAPAAGASMFEDWRADRLMFRGMVVTPHAGYRFALVTGEIPAAVVSAGMVGLAAHLIASGVDREDAADMVTAVTTAFESLTHVGRWHGDNSDTGERFVGFVADENGIIVDSRFDPSTVGQDVAELLGPDALGHATASGARYIDDSGVDVVLLSTPQGWVVGGGVTGR